MVKFEPYILISIVNWMNYWDTIKCINLCKNISYTKFKILIIDNNSKNESINKIREAHPDIEIICLKKNKGFASGHYASFQYLKKNKYDAIWILNPDIVFNPDILTNFVKAWGKKGDAIFGSIQTDEEFNKLYFVGGYRIKPNFEIDYSLQTNKFFYNKSISSLPDEIDTAEYVTGASFLIPENVIERIGFLDKKLFMYGEEIDYCYRARQNKILSYYVAGAPICHNSTQSLKLNEFLKRIYFYYNNRNYFLFAFKYNILSRKKVIKDNLGLKNLLISIFILFIKFNFQKKNRLLLQENYYSKLGMLHALIGIKGKIVNPEHLL